MARDWQDLFILGDDGGNRSEGESAPVSGAEEESSQQRAGRFGRLRDSLRRTRQALPSEIQATLFEETLTEETWERLEEALIYADVGAQTTARVVQELEQEGTSGGLVGGGARSAPRSGQDGIDPRPAPTVILVAGVNGTGKPTSVGKLAWHAAREGGRSVVLAAADTLPAAGVEQLEVWSQRAGARFIKGQPGADPGSVAYDAIATARRDGADAVIIDHAG